MHDEEDKVKLDKERAQCFHSTLVHLLFVMARCRRVIQTFVAFVTTRVEDPDEDDWAKLRWVLKYEHGTVYLSLNFDASQMTLVQWWVDGSFAVFLDYRSHTGAVLLLGKRGVTSILKQRF